MAIDKGTRLKAEAKLSSGMTSREVSEEMGIAYITVHSWKNKLEDQDAEATVCDLVKVDKDALRTVKQMVEENAPPKVAKEIGKVVDGIVGLQSLEPKFLTVVTKLLEAAEEMAGKDDLSIKDWVAISNGIGQLYSNIYNKSGTNINVLNQNQVNGERMSMFKGSMRG